MDLLTIPHPSLQSYGDRPSQQRFSTLHLWTCSPGFMVLLNSVSKYCDHYSLFVSVLSASMCVKCHQVPWKVQKKVILILTVEDNSASGIVKIQTFFDVPLSTQPLLPDHRHHAGHTRLRATLSQASLFSLTSVSAKLWPNPDLQIWNRDHSNDIYVIFMVFMVMKTIKTLKGLMSVPSWEL